jgi:putative transposase
MRLTFKYRLYPTKAQQNALKHTLEQCRLTYNSVLAVRKDAYERAGQSLSLYDTQRLLPAWKEEWSPLKDVFSQVLQNVCVRVDLAFQAFFRRIKAGEKSPGYPRFKGPGRYDSFTYPQLGFKLAGDKLCLSKIGDVKIKLHRPMAGTIKTLTVRRASTGKWFACFSVEVEFGQPDPSPWTVGIDVGLEKFATLSTGDTIPNPRFFRKEERALTKAQRKLSRLAKGTPERARARKVVARVHERIKHRRADFTHQLSRKLADTFQIIALEDLRIPNMLKNHSLAKSISDAAWDQLIQYTMYKAAWAGRRVVLVVPRNTSQACSGCGELVKKALHVRVHSCPGCGLQLDRDVNAALNILALGLQSIGFDP